MSLDFKLTALASHKDHITPSYLAIIKKIRENLKTKNTGPTVYGGCTLTSLRNGAIIMVQTTEIVYPMVDDPYIMGRIACSCVLSDIYSYGITECQNILMFFGLSTNLSEKDKDAVSKSIFKGFKDQARVAGTEVNGGQTVLNPWITLGGSATSICSENEIIFPYNSDTGDVLILTKPLGTEIAIKAFQCLNDSKNSVSLLKFTTTSEITNAYNVAIQSMTRLNKTAAALMKKYSAKAAVTISERGLIGHAQDLALIQKNAVNFHFYSFPMIANMAKISKAMDWFNNVQPGSISEINGGLLIVISGENANRFCNDMLITEGYRPWIIGVVAVGDRKAYLENCYHITEVQNISAVDNWTGSGVFS